MLKKEGLISMAEVRGEWCVSVYMPLNQSNAKQKRICLKNLMSEAEKKLLGLEMAPQKIARMLGPVEMIFESPAFWNDRKEGLAAFFTPDSFVWYSMQYQFDELVVVTDRFHLKPLLRNAAKIGRFHLLVLSEKRIRFYEASQIGIREVQLKGMPRNLSFIVNSETIGRPRSADDSGVLHGRGEIGEEKKSRLADLFRQIDATVADYLKDDESPLMLAGAGYLHRIYREAGSYPQLVKAGVAGDVDDLTALDLLKKALPVMRPVFRRKRERALEIYREKLGKGLASNNLSKIFKAAKLGRIETLFVPIGQQKWGKFDDRTDELQISGQPRPGDKDLLCVASSRTLRRGGEVFVVRPEQMPDESSIAAILRN